MCLFFGVGNRGVMVRVVYVGCEEYLLGDFVGCEIFFEYCEVFVFGWVGDGVGGGVEIGEGVFVCGCRSLRCRRGFGSWSLGGGVSISLRWKGRNWIYKVCFFGRWIRRCCWVWGS